MAQKESHMPEIDGELVGKIGWVRAEVVRYSGDGYYLVRILGGNGQWLHQMVAESEIKEAPEQGGRRAARESGMASKRVFAACARAR